MGLTRLRGDPTTSVLSGGGTSGSSGPSSTVTRSWSHEPACMNPKHWTTGDREAVQAQRKVQPLERYLAFVDSSAGPDACWPWTGTRRRTGHAGNFWDGTYLPSGRPRYVGAARWGYTHFVGTLVVGMFVCHHCDNPPCMNPKHWFSGTAADNAADRDAKGRGRPQRVHRRLTAESARAIKADRLSGMTLGDVADRYSISQHHVWAIASGKCWAE
jgi:hypothetical protein